MLWLLLFSFQCVVLLIGDGGPELCHTFLIFKDLSRIQESRSSTTESMTSTHRVEETHRLL
jgi:hypothetical protein